MLNLVTLQHYTNRGNHVRYRTAFLIKNINDIIDLEKDT